MPMRTSSGKNLYGDMRIKISGSASRIRLLALLPLGVAFFALCLYISDRSDPTPRLAHTGLLDEREFMLEIERNGRLEDGALARDFLGRKGSHEQHFNSRIQQNKVKIPDGFENGVDWIPPNPSEGNVTKVAFMVTTSEHPDQIILWMAYHRALGVSFFYLFTEGIAGMPESIERLTKEPGVSVIPKDKNLTDAHARSHAWEESWLSAFFNKPCNHELFVKQSLNMEIGIVFAREDKADWILHIDTDELIYPAGTKTFSLLEILDKVPDNVDTLVFPNYESLAETEDVVDPFLEVTLFKRNYAHVDSKEYFANYGRVQRNNPNYFTTYGNGKSAARVVDGLRPNGAHRWYNYYRAPKEISAGQSAVLHYTYNRFSDLKSRRDRCDCAPMKEEVEKCFILDFDRLAFMEASLSTDDELMRFFKDRLVWDDKSEVDDLLKKGLFGRLYEPQLLLRGIKQSLMQRGKIGTDP
jgi:hypothetical protein